MKRIVRRGIKGGVVGFLFGAFTTVTWYFLGSDVQVLWMAIPFTLAFGLFGAWFASVPLLSEDERSEQDRARFTQGTDHPMAA